MKNLLCSLIVICGMVVVGACNYQEPEKQHVYVGLHQEESLNSGQYISYVRFGDLRLWIGEMTNYNKGNCGIEIICISPVDVHGDGIIDGHFIVYKKVE